MLIKSQLPCGAWSAYTHAGPPNAFQTAFTLLALRHTQTDQQLIEHAFAWLSDLMGIEDHWLWKWKFRLFDRAVVFDPAKTGWPWIPGTVSWVAPTALTMLAFRAWGRESPRLVKGAAMLMDRACPSGGWNPGNSVVLGVALDPHPDFTAMALLALRNYTNTDNPTVVAALDYLANRFKDSASAYSLAWAVMALAANKRDEASDLQHRLESQLAKANALPPRVLGLCALALEYPPFNFVEVAR